MRYNTQFIRNLLGYRFWIWVSGFLLVWACKKESIHNSQPVASLVLVPDARMPYTFTETDGRVMVRSIHGLKVFARSTAETQNWLHLQGANFTRIIGGIDTLGLLLDEFFDSLHVGSTRSTIISVYSNGTPAINAEITQRSYPFIFSTSVYQITDPTSTQSSTQGNSTTAAKASTNISRNGKLWTLSINLQDTDKIVFLPIYYTRTNPELKYTRGQGLSNRDSLLYSIGAKPGNPPTPKFIDRDTSLVDEKYLQLKLKVDKDNLPSTPIATIAVGEAPEQISLQIKVHK